MSASAHRTIVKEELLAGWLNQSMAIVIIMVVIAATDHGNGGAGGY